MSAWSRFQKYFVRLPDLGFSMDISRMNFEDEFFSKMQPLVNRAFEDMRNLEKGAIANPDEDRMVGHYWLRNFKLAPTPGLCAMIEQDIADAKAFAVQVHDGAVAPQRGGKFSRLLIVGIGGSALGPQLVTDALVDSWKAPVRTHFFDNTDPEGIQRVLEEIGGNLAHTLTVVISKSGGTAESRNGMLEARAAYERHGLDFARHAVAITETIARHEATVKETIALHGEPNEKESKKWVPSKLEKYATENHWLKIFPMTDWVGGRTSVLSTVGLIPMALQGVLVDAILAGAAAMDEQTRKLPMMKNPAMLMALMWHHAGGGKGAKDMVILPYKDRLVLFSKYLQQLVMESLGKELDRNKNKVNQGIAVYGNKGSTDQHAYVQQLREGVNNFFATFIEVRKGANGPQVEVEPETTCADFLQGFLRGTRKALHENGRESITISIQEVSASSLGSIIALFERAVSFYASLVNINAYHQPGVEAGKKAAGDFLTVLSAVRSHMAKCGRPVTADHVAKATGADPEEVYFCLRHLAANDSRISYSAGDGPGSDAFEWSTGT